MHRRCLLCKFCAVLLIHIDAVAKCQMRSDHDGSMSAASHQGIAFYALRSCHHILHGNRGEFFSPDYLCSNPALWCNWTIQVLPGNRVQIYLKDLTPDHMCHLKTDQIHLDESPVSGGENRILERCWRSSVYTSLSNTVHVVQLIRSNPNPPHRGFYGVYQAFGMPKTPDLNKDLSEEERAKTESEVTVTKIPRQNGASNDLEENIVDSHHVDHLEGSQSQREENEVLKVTPGFFRESRKVRGEAKNREVSVHAALPLDDVEELVLAASTERPNFVTVQKYTSMMINHEAHGPDTLALAYTTQSIPTSSGTTVTRATRKKASKRKQLHTNAKVNKNEVTHCTKMDTRTPDLPTEAIMVEPPTPLVEDVRPVSMETGVVPVMPAAPEENGPNSKKMNQSSRIKGKSLSAQNFILATDPPPSPDDCSRISVPTLLYTVCFLLCFLIVLLMLALGAMYRRSHCGTFLPHCRCNSSFTDTDVNNNPNSGNGGDGNTSRLPPPPPPLCLDGGAHDLPLLRFSPLLPPDGKPQKDNDTR